MTTQIATHHADEVENAKKLMAEIHFILMTKEKNHDLSADDKFWMEFSKPYYVEMKKEIAESAITMSLMMARLQGKEYVSQVTGTPINHAMLRIAKLKLTKDRINVGKKAKEIIGKLKDTLTGNHEQV